MPELSIPWRPRVLLPGRVFRLPVVSDQENPALERPGFSLIDVRWDARTSARYFYLRAPATPGDYTLTARCEGLTASTVINVRALAQLRAFHVYNGATWPRRWPLHGEWASTKRRQTLQDLPLPSGVDQTVLAWWASQTDATLWRQFPCPEFPQAHFVNVTQGCPSCGTAIFRHGGFYPWKRNHLPLDFRSTCPSCQSVFPSNNVLENDYTGGPCPDDGFGYFDEAGRIYLFTATYHRDQLMRFDAGMQLLTGSLRTGLFDPDVARRLAVMLLRYAIDVLYIAAAPQFRYGPSLGVEQPWDWGQPDWADEADPVAALTAKGMRRYCIDIPYVSETLSLAYDTVWPLIRDDRETVERAQALDVSVNTSEDVIHLIEEMLACKLQCTLDRGARSNLPRESMGALTLLRGLDRPDAQAAMDWLYDEGPDRLRVFCVNDFLPDGSPPEATGGYNGIHTNGLFALEYHLHHLRRQHPGAYPVSRYPSLVDDPRAVRVACQPHETTMIGKTWFQYGDGGAPGSMAMHDRKAGALSTLRLKDPVLLPGVDLQTLVRAEEFTGGPMIAGIRDAAEQGRPRKIGTTIHDGVGIAILRTGETPERAALGVVYGDVVNHRHMDLLDVQLFAFDRPFLTDLGYPQSWATIRKWEGHWATHNALWTVIPGADPNGIAGRGRLIRTLFTDGLQILDLEAERYVWDAPELRWRRPGGVFRRLVALIETDGDGIAVIDLSRIRGGAEHWRICRGLQGSFEADGLAFTPRSGTAADPLGTRGDIESLAAPDYLGLACMDDVSTTAATPVWRGTWTSHIEPDVHLDVIQIGVSPSTELINARSTAMMGTPEESAYRFRTLLWRRHPEDERNETRVDLVMEPRVGAATLTDVRVIPVAQGDPDAAAVSLSTKGGKRITVYWSPGSGNHEETVFEDGTAMTGPLMAAIGDLMITTGVSRIRWNGVVHEPPGPATGRITALSRQERTIEVEGITGINAGDRVRINPDGRGHNYAVERVEPLPDGRLRLTLSVTSLLGRARIVSCEGDTLELGASIMARTGNLNRTHLTVDATDIRAEIEEACNAAPGRTTVKLAPGAQMTGLSEGDWISVVDYVTGDAVLFEPTALSGR